MLSTAVKAARKAGAIINRASNDLDIDLVRVTAKGRSDFVTEADKAAEEAIIDTLGTAYPQYAVSIALEHKGQLSQAGVYDPTRNELFTTSKGRDAFLNDRRIRVSRRTPLRDALIGTGFPFKQLKHLDEDVRMFKRITTEMAGGALMITEAGGMITDFQGPPNDLGNGRVVCGAPKVHEQVVALVQDIHR